MLKIKMLGGFEVRFNEQLLTDFQSVKVEALLAYLIYNKEKPIRRDGLTGLLWSDQGQEQAQTNLRKSLSRLKQAIGTAVTNIDYVLADRTFLQLNEDAEYEVDVWTFEQLLHNCPTHHNNHNIECETCISSLKPAISLYKGEFLSNLFVQDAELFDAWLVQVRENLHYRALNAIQSLAQYHEFRGDYQKAIVYARQEISLEPWLEEAHRQIMRLLTYQGEYNAALGHYQICVNTLQEHLGIVPTAETQALAKRIQQLPEKRLHNLPRFQDKALIKRGQEYQQIRQYLVNPDYKLITLRGIGGIGKTTLALEVAWPVIDEHFGPFADGICFISLSEESLHFSRLATELADFFSISLSPSVQPEKILFQQIKYKECLLILDNGEYLGDEGKQFIHALLKSAFSIKILVTSRESLKLSSEHIITIEGLSLPEITTRDITSPLQTSGALNLFEKRGQKLLPNFRWENLDNLNQEALIQICYLTQGLPLALELAATWVSKLSCQEIAQEIQNSLNILANQYHDIPDRHQSMRAVFTYSWKLLSHQEQENLMALAVFPADFDLEASRVIAGVQLFELSDLIDKSLLRTVFKSSRSYYQMHTLLRQFVLEYCSPEFLQALRHKHVNYYINFLDSHRRHLRSAETSNIAQQLSSELDNLQAAWLWTVETRQFQNLNMLLDGLYEYYTIKAWWQEGLNLFSSALKLFQAQDMSIDTEISLLYTRLLTRIAEFHSSLGELSQAESFIRQAQKMIQLIEEPSEMAFIYEKLGQIAYQYGNFIEAEQNMQFGLQIIETHHPRIALNAHLLMSLGAIARDLGDWQRAETFFQRSFVIYQALPSEWGMAHTQRLLANIYIEMQDFEKGISFAKESLSLFQNMKDLIGEALILRELGHLDLLQVNYSAARSKFEKALEILKKKQNVKSRTLLHKDLGEMLIESKNYGEAQPYLIQAFNDAYKSRDTLVLLESLALLVKAMLLDRQDNSNSSQLIALIQFLRYNSYINYYKFKKILSEINVFVSNIYHEGFPTGSINGIEDIYILISSNFNIAQ